MRNKIILSTPVTHSDWLWRYRKRIGHGRDGVRYIVDRCKDAGLRRLYWRCFDGGQALYHSRLMDGVSAGFAADNYHAWVSPGKDVVSFLKDYPNDFDSLKEAVQYAHTLGVEIHAWLSINEDDHGWGLISRFSKAHPECRWVKRSGLPYNSQLSFAFPEVRKYKLNLLKEVLRYDLDGVFFDWMRTGDVRNEPQTTPDGTADFGYEKPLVKGFQKKYGRDPRKLPNNDKRWVHFRAEPQTIFMREAHKLIKAKSDRLRISIMGHHPWSCRGATPHVNGNLNGLLLDVRTWAKEGLIDEAVAAGYFSSQVKGGTPKKAFEAMKAEVDDRCAVCLYWWLPANITEFRKSLRVARRLGVKHLLYWESDYLDLPDRATDAEQLAVTMSAYARP